MDEDGVEVTGKAHEVDVMLINMNQIACILNSDRSHYVALEWNGQSVVPPESGNAFLLITRDTQCYECDPEAQTCQLKDVGFSRHILSGSVIVSNL